MKIIKSYLPIVVLLPAVGLVGCGGTGGTGSGSSSRTIGVVSSVNNGSVTVGNVTFDTSSTSVSSNEISSVSEITPGMIVTVNGSVDDVTKTGTADDIDYDAEVEGIVDSIGGGMMVVMGQNVDISQSPTFVSKMAGITDVNNIPTGAIVEVSGYSDNLGNIVATFIKLKDHMASDKDNMELEGIITNLLADSFMIGNQVIYFDAGKIDLMPEEGLNVEVDVMMDTTGTLYAVKIKTEDDFGDDGSDADIEGVVTSALANGEFGIMGHVCRLADNVVFKGGLTEASLMEGAVVEVEGHLVDGVFVVTKVGNEDESNDDSSHNGTVDTMPDMTPGTTTDPVSVV